MTILGPRSPYTDGKVPLNPQSHVSGGQDTLTSEIKAQSLYHGPVGDIILQMTGTIYSYPFKYIDVSLPDSLTRM